MFLAMFLNMSMSSDAGLRRGVGSLLAGATGVLFLAGALLGTDAVGGAEAATGEGTVADAGALLPKDDVEPLL